MARISFGTSGWRGILGEDFTFESVRVVTQAIADHVKESSDGGTGIVVGYDTRFLGERFARETARVLTGAGIKTFLCDRDTPTPVIAFEILRRGAAGGINFTASHNPCDYNGIKFSPSSGGPALPETTKDIERRANEMLGEICFQERDLDAAYCGGLLEVIDPRPAYLADLENKIDFAAIAVLKGVAVNPLYGTGRGYLDDLLSRHGVNVRRVNTHKDPYFGGFPPEPAEQNIQDFINLVKADPNICLGLATDGDADRYGIIDSDGTYIEPNYVLALLLDYLVRSRGLTGGTARSVATSHLLDAVARKYGLQVHETPVGFKYIGELISQGRIIIGGEESAGLSICGHVPEKDGILACLLVAEMVAKEGASVRELVQRLYRDVGSYFTRRENINLSPELSAAYVQRMAETPGRFAGKEVVETVVIDGAKYILSDGSWLLFRKSGTEPVVRLYGEAATPNDLAELMAAGREFILNGV